MKNDFVELKSKSINLAKGYLKIPDSVEHPRAYAIGINMLSAAFRLYKTAISTERTANELKCGWADYFFLNTFCDNEQFQEWLDFAQNKCSPLKDDFLPDGWPDLTLSRCNSLLEASISFAWTFSRFTKDSFRDIENPGPRQKVETFLKKISKAFDNLSVTLLDVYEKNISAGLAEKCSGLLEKELGLYVRWLHNKSVQTDKAGHSKQNNVTALIEDFNKKMEELLLPKKEPKRKLITKKVALNKFNVSESTLFRDLHNTVIKSYRPKKAKKTAQHLFDEAELSNRYEKR